jgi:hypothetical protein
MNFQKLFFLFFYLKYLLLLSWVNGNAPSDHTAKTTRRLTWSIRYKPVYSCGSNEPSKGVWLPTSWYIAWQIVSTWCFSLTRSTYLLKSYLSNRKQQTKINSVLSGWADFQKGIPQWSIHGLLLVQCFLYKRYVFIYNKNGSCIIMQTTISFHSVTLTMK